MSITRCRIATAALLLTPSIVFAWGADGHRIVRGIASHYLNPYAQ